MKARFSGTRGIYFIVAILVSLLSIGVSIAVGSTSIPLTDVYKILSNHLLFSDFQGNWSKADDAIVWQIRAPRVALAFLVGASLALAGTAFQGMLRNPLADPYTLGVSSGASLGAVIAITFQLSLGFLGIYNLPLFALAGAFFALFLVYRLSYLGNRIMIETLILSGIIISSFLGSIISLLISLSGDELRQIIFWLMGSVAMRDWGHVLMLLPILLISFLLLLWNSRELNIMAFGDETAQYIGVEVEKSKKWILFSSSLLTAAAVSVSGTIGFVGLVVPHLVRIIIGPNHIHLLPFSLFGGGIFLVIADTLARTIISPSELPLGVITALIGAPVFATILVRRHLERER
jgi:iron complex transport system permease protein